MLSDTKEGGSLSQLASDGATFLLEQRQTFFCSLFFVLKSNKSIFGIDLLFDRKYKKKYPFW
jgi:hypothetical protein